VGSCVTARGGEWDDAGRAVDIGVPPGESVVLLSLHGEVEVSPKGSIWLIDARRIRRS